MSDITSYIKQANTLPPEALLGHVMISTSRDGAYDRDSIVALFQDLDLDTSLVPPISGAVDAFNKAITKNKETQHVLGNGNTVSLLIRTVTSTNPDDFLVRAVSREVRNAQRAQLTYEAVGEIQLYKGTRRGPTRRMDHGGARFTFAMVPPQQLPHMTESDFAHVRELAKVTKRDWERYRSTLDGRKVGTMVLNYLRKLGAVRLKDSVHFVPVAHEAEANRLRKAINQIGECRLEALPLVDMTDQREMILRAFLEESEEALNSLASEAHQALSARPSLATYTRIRRAYDDLEARTQLYVNTLGDAAARASAAHDVLKATLVALSRAL